MGLQILVISIMVISYKFGSYFLKKVIFRTAQYAQQHPKLWALSIDEN